MILRPFRRGFLSAGAAVVVAALGLGWLSCPALAFPAAAENQAPAGPLTGFFNSYGYTALRLRRNGGNHMEVLAKINGRSGLFLLDTGAQITVLNRASLPRFGLIGVKTSVKVYGALGGPGERIEAALASSIELGPCTVSPFLLGVSDLGTLNQDRRRGGEGHFDGIIGADLLQTFAFVIDCQSPQLFAKDPGTATGRGAHPDLGPYLKERGYGEVAMRKQAISDFEVSADINRRRALLLVDTGAAITLLDSALSRQAGIDFRRTDYTVGGAGGGKQRIAIGVVRNLSFSSLRMRSAEIAISDISAIGAQLKEEGRPALNGYLGADFLKQKSAVIDCSRMRLYLKN